MIAKDLLVNGNASITGTLRVGGDVLASKSYVDDVISTTTSTMNTQIQTKVEEQKQKYFKATFLKNLNGKTHYICIRTNSGNYFNPIIVNIGYAGSCIFASQNVPPIKFDKEISKYGNLGYYWGRDNNSNYYNILWLRITCYSNCSILVPSVDSVSNNYPSITVTTTAPTNITFKTDYKIYETTDVTDTISTNLSNLTTTVGTKLNISGDNGTEAGVSALINKLDVGEVTPGDETYYISQAIGNSAFCKRPLKALWEYIKNKLSSTFGIGGTKTDNAIVRFDGTTGKIQNTGITIDDSNNINMITTGMTGTSNKIVFNGSTDGADIYYQATASDRGNLVLNTRDDATSYIRFANNGNFNSYISTIDGIYHGNIDNGKIYTKNDTVSINSNTLNRNALYITGNTYGNNTTDVKTAGKLSFGDAGPQIIFCMEKEIGSNSQPLALIYTDNDAIRPGVSLHLVSNQSEAWFVSHSIQALSRLRIPTSAPSNPQNGDIWIS